MRSRRSRRQPGALQDRPRGLGVARRESAGKRERACALLGREQDVARRQGEPVLVPHGRDHLERELEVEIGEHPAQHLDLLRVLLAVEGDVRPNDVEQLEADRRHPAEVARAVLAFEDRAELGHLDPGLVPGRVHLGRGRREDDVDAGRRATSTSRASSRG